MKPTAPTKVPTKENDPSLHPKKLEKRSKFKPK